MEEVHVVAPHAPANTPFFVKLYGPPMASIDLGLPQIRPYGGECARLVDIFGDVFQTMNNGGVFKVEVCGDLNKPKSCFSQNFKVKEWGGGEGGAGGAGGAGGEGGAGGHEEPLLGKLHVIKSYAGDPSIGGDVELSGWHVDLEASDGTVVPLETPVEIDLLPGTYTVTERRAKESNWYNSTETFKVVEITAGATTEVEFRNYCTRKPGGHTMGWWQNKNGEADMRTDLAGDLDALNALNLKNGQGNDQDFALNDYAGFKAWIKGAKANPMAYMLSTQLATMVLATRHGYTDPSVYVGKDETGTWIQGDGLVAWADRLLYAFDKNRPDANKSAEGKVKDLIDEINNGAKSYLQPVHDPDGCPYTFD
ncbi:hypothetical protein [Vulgatibacter incomptus]|uniref:Uncharacterized protein n=1 Tax=Vulgatibacter incomptus TaxID=1391653 RepID=A0A0K1PDY2_9BACT|nr:hypothetical protein [Vulgatibacter incomptus]AKU91702.1 hypothetical protein AKJ08_2089 [Vulgatibacter incomptus]